MLPLRPMHVPKIPTLGEWLAAQPELKRGDVERFLTAGRAKWLPDRAPSRKARLTEKGKKAKL